MRNIFRDAYERLPDSQQHLTKAVGASSAAVAMAAYGTLSIRPRKEGYKRAVDAATDGLNAGNQAVIRSAAVLMWVHIASSEYKDYQEARSLEANQPQS